MANTKSAEKRIEINRRNQLRNRFYKSSVRTLIKGFLKDIKMYKISKTPETEKKLKKSLSSVYSLIDKGTKKNIFHKNTAARKKAQLSEYLKMTEFLNECNKYINILKDCLVKKIFNFLNIILNI